MTCPTCARTIDAGSSFCRHCGVPVTPAPPPVPRRLVRLPGMGQLAGVCAGLAAYFGVDLTLVRLAWVLLTIFPGALVGGVVAYLAAWAIIPAGAPAPDLVVPPSRLVRSRTDRKIAGVCGGLAAYLGVDSTLLRVAVVILSIYPGAIICGLIAYLIAWLIIPGETLPTLEPSPSTP